MHVTVPTSEPLPAACRGPARHAAFILHHPSPTALLARGVWGPTTFAIALLCASPARAQAGAPAEARDPASSVEAESASIPPAPAGAAGADAEARYRDGIAEFEAGHWREAVELFKQADALAPSPWLSFNIAKIFERMRDGRSALAWYRDYVRRCHDSQPLPDVLARIAELEADLEDQGLQQLSVLSTPPGATVLLDGASRGVTPFTGELAPGAHVLELRLEGHHDTWRELKLPAEHAIDVEVALTALQTAAAMPSDSSGAARRPSASPPLPGVVMETEPSASWWTWALFGGSAALLLGSGAVELSRRGIEDDARDTPEQIDYARRYDQVESRKDTARALLGASALLGIAGGVSLYLDLRRTSSVPVNIGLGCAPRLCGVLARQTW